MDEKALEAFVHRGRGDQTVLRLKLILWNERLKAFGTHGLQLHKLQQWSERLFELIIPKIVLVRQIGLQSMAVQCAQAVIAYPALAKQAVEINVGGVAERFPPPDTPSDMRTAMWGNDAPMNIADDLWHGGKDEIGCFDVSEC